MRVTLGGQVTFEVTRGAPRARRHRRRRTNWPAISLATTLAIEIVAGLAVLVLARLLGLL